MIVQMQQTEPIYESNIGTLNLPSRYSPELVGINASSLLHSSNYGAKIAFNNASPIGLKRSSVGISAMNHTSPIGIKLHRLHNSVNPKAENG